MNDARVITASFDFFSLLSRDTKLEKVGTIYWAGPCRLCGCGTDRLSVKQIGTNEYLWVCRVCSPGKYKDAIDYVMKRNSMNFIEAINWMGSGSALRSGSTYDYSINNVESQKRIAERQAEIDERIADLTTHEIWDALHRRMAEDNRVWWRSQGITDDWQDYLSLGFTPDKVYYDKEHVLQHCPAYTIPYFHYDESCPDCKRFVTLQYRLVNPPTPNDRYRFEYGVGSSYFNTTPTSPMKDIAVICEGAKKAIVTRILGGLKDASVLGVPSKSDTGKIEEGVKGVGRVYVILDPDSVQRAYQVAESIGKKIARVVEMPMKIDDAFVSRYLSQGLFSKYLRNAVKL